MSQDYRLALNDAYYERRMRNPSYSLRAFARDIGMASSNLSMVLKKRKGITLQTAVKISKRLSFSEFEKTLFCNLVEKEHARSKTARARAAQEISKTQSLKSNLSLDMMKVVGGWFHFTLIELLRTPSFTNHSYKGMAEALETKETEVEDAIKTLVGLELIKKENLKFYVINESNWSSDGVPSEIIRKAHEKHLLKSKEALFTQTVEERDFTSMILPIDHSDLPSAKKDIRNFLKMFTDKYSEKSTADRVYSMNIQLFNLTPGLNRGKK